MMARVRYPKVAFLIAPLFFQDIFEKVICTYIVNIEEVNNSWKGKRMTAHSERVDSIVKVYLKFEREI